MVDCQTSGNTMIQRTDHFILMHFEQQKHSLTDFYTNGLTLLIISSFWGPRIGPNAVGKQGRKRCIELVAWVCKSRLGDLVCSYPLRRCLFLLLISPCCMLVRVAYLVLEGLDGMRRWAAPLFNASLRTSQLLEAQTPLPCPLYYVQITCLKCQQMRHQDGIIDVSEKIRSPPSPLEPLILVHATEKGEKKRKRKKPENWIELSAKTVTESQLEPIPKGNKRTVHAQQRARRTV